MSADIDLTAAEWIKSSYSGSNGGQCVEFSRSFAPVGVVPVRDSKDPHGPALVFPADGWSAFVTAIRCGEFPAT
ncbi:hypothetical protein SBI_06731 [Streptomyces bingchenggensis BCW-1]|uniref:DUF397 domain-containing protein n=1 Tax=Streptomyces bingchenggensis (strain BCW-1) TaxID=749414 RepID=D7BXV3_STRBB|nr:MULTISPECIES: DUF397 domain-containing protein [Streptomyces]ADI09851.1 hypothetical protein SBI_06731 [Streptomyces bingchenggensis BCW-1]